MPPWFVKALNEIFKAFLWSGTDVVQGGKCAVAWVRVQRLLALGGIGIFDPQRLGIALHALVMAAAHQSFSALGGDAVQSRCYHNGFFQCLCRRRTGGW
jgi:hypothetical protein